MIKLALAGGQRGAVLAEFAVVFSILFFLLMMCFEVGLMVQAQLVLASAAREGGRQAAVDGGFSPRVRDRIEDLLALGGLEEDEAVISVQPGQAAYGRPINVRVAYPYRVRSGVLRAFLPAIVDLEAGVVTRSERLPDGG